MLDLQTVLREIPARPDPGELVAGFVPPPRFADKRFEARVRRLSPRE